MARRRWLPIPLFFCVFLAGCNQRTAKKPDPTKGSVTGIVLCADTGKPARFATVTLSAAPRPGEKVEEGNPLEATETTLTDLEGRFRLEAVEPGRYVAFATQDGYLDPALALDPAKLTSFSSDKDRHQYAIDLWKDHLTEVAVHVHRVAELALQIERGAEISGTVAFDDGSPAIGMRFQLFRKTEKGDLTDVGLPLFDAFALHAVSDGHGRYSLANLPAGEYTVCTLMPSGSPQEAPRVCLGNTFRRKQAASLKVGAGETARGADIEIPLSGLHAVAGTVTALPDGHSVGHGVVRLLYADDRERARETALADDGSFSFEYVPEGRYILAVSGAQDQSNKESEPNPAGEAITAKLPPVRRYADKETPVIVMDGMDGLEMRLTAAPVEKPLAQ